MNSLIILRQIVGHVRRVGCCPISIFQFIYYNYFSKHVRNNYRKDVLFIPYRRCRLKFCADSIIVLDGKLELGIPSSPKSNRFSYLYMKEKSKIIVHNNCSILDDFDIQIHKGGIWEIYSFHSNTGLEVSCGNTIEMKGDVTCGRHVRIKDFNGHYVSSPHYPLSAPILIDDHVWLCTGCTINPGVHVGSGSVIADNSNVVDDVEPYTFNQGNPSVIVDRNIEFKI